MKRRPLRSDAATIASASSRVSAIGFSRKTCLPAASDASVHSRWSGVGKQMSMASTSGSFTADCRSSVSSAPTEAAMSAARSLLREPIDLTRTRSPSAA